MPLFLRELSTIMKLQHFLPAALIFLLLSCGNNNSNDSNDAGSPSATIVPAAIDYTVVKTYPHDTSSYTQGLIWHNNTLYEGTGRVGYSKLAKIDIETGKASQQQFNAKNEFGEGITILDNKIYQLTWENHKVYVYDAESFKKLQEFAWPYEGWGITTDGKNLIISTGGSNIYYVNPSDFKILRTVGVTDNYGPVDNINELEYINGFIYANKYLTTYILKINPETGTVTGRLDLKDIFQKSGKTYDAGMIPDPTEDVLNGIAYDSAKNSLYVTGKQWPLLFEIKIN
ncbi:glutaminyl-peptide cyclotransferase [Filimonas effusa]|uniref:Glutaminyl-peptide cyclotransferase n=2 Tax=Filimonas effusa TaxID=2508721 RepID=A0A4Q1DES3_9BACT|nr:glutaminyl-peptide cyclotransferase [Filimonas effusa]